MQMQDSINTSIDLTSLPPDVLQKSIALYDDMLSEASVRLTHVLEAYQAKFPDKASFVTYLLNSKPEDAYSIKNCGSKSVRELGAIIETIWRRMDEPYEPKPEPKQVYLPENIDQLLPVVEAKASSLTVRVFNCFDALLDANGRSLSKLYATITSSTFKAARIKHLGKQSLPEMQQFLDDLKVFLQSFDSIESVCDAVELSHRSSLKDLHIPSDEQERIFELQNTLGYFPLFAAIDAYLENLSGENKAIVEGCIRVHKEQTIRDRKEVAVEIGITSERVRQKRNQLFETISSDFSSFKTYGFVKDNPYTYQMTHIEDVINSTEGTDYTLNFINWVLASVFDDITLVGDVIKTLANYYEKDNFLGLVPTEQCSYFDFESFLKDIEERFAEKKVDEVRVNLKAIINMHLKVQYCEEQLPAIETSCRSLLYLHYPVEVDFGQIIFPANARKNNPIIVEEILRDAGHPMTMDEIYDEFTYRYPERCAVYDSFRGNISNNPNIVPIGRSSTYALAEWQEGEHRGGTIRSFVEEYLETQNQPIASLESLGEYVRRFRPDTEDNSIASNLLQEKSQKYALFERDGIRYIGYRDGEYDESFVSLEYNRPHKRATEDSMALLKAFIKEHHHFPLFQDNDPEETRLSRFVDNMRSLYNRGLMKQKDVDEWEPFINEYGAYRVSRKTAEEIETIASLIHEYLNTIEFPFGFRSRLEIVDQLMSYYVLKYREEDKEETIRPFLNVMVNDEPCGKHHLDYIIDRYVFQTKRGADWDGREWITEDVLQYFKYDDESIRKMRDEMEQIKM